MTTPRYICTQGACYHVRPLTMMQEQVLYLCTYETTLPLICQDTWYPPAQVAQILNYLMLHGLVRPLPVSAEPLEPSPLVPPEFPRRSFFAHLVRRIKRACQRFDNRFW